MGALGGLGRMVPGFHQRSQTGKRRGMWVGGGFLLPRGWRLRLRGARRGRGRGRQPGALGPGVGGPEWGALSKAFSRPC